MTSPRLELAIRELADALLAELQATRPEAGPDRLLSIDEAAERCGLGRTSLYELIGRGELATIKVGRRRLVAEAAVTDFIAQQAPR
jgi:excisionase family DNA binding protein